MPRGLDLILQALPACLPGLPQRVAFFIKAIYLTNAKSWNKSSTDHLELLGPSVGSQLRSWEPAGGHIVRGPAQGEKRSCQRQLSGLEFLFFSQRQNNSPFNHIFSLLNNGDLGFHLQWRSHCEMLDRCQRPCAPPWAIQFNKLLRPLCQAVGQPLEMEQKICCSQFPHLQNDNIVLKLYPSGGGIIEWLKAGFGVGLGFRFLVHNLAAAWS